MKKIKSREQWLNEEEQREFDMLDENAEVDIDIKLEDGPEEVMKALDDLEVKQKEAMPFGVIKAKAMKKRLDAIKKLPGVEDVEIVKKK